MGDAHNYSFFGQKAGMFVHSPSRETPFIFLQCIKRKENGSWEKPSKGEGKRIKCNMEEIVWMLEVLENGVKSWSTYHEFKEEKTQIAVKWGDEKDKVLWIHVGEYSKKLNWAQARILAMLLKHFLKEKIEHTTSSKTARSSNAINESPEPETVNQDEEHEQVIEKDDKLEIVEEYIAPEGTQKVDGMIKIETEKALLIQLPSGQEAWFPKSTIRSRSDTGEGKSTFFIDTWFLEKQKIEI